jgi:hypothetical protein
MKNEVHIGEEIERLRTALSAAQAALTEYGDEMVKARAEIERLRAALKPFAKRVGAVSLSAALGHITREHLLEARRALAVL